MCSCKTYIDFTQQLEKNTKGQVFIRSLFSLICLPVFKIPNHLTLSKNKLEELMITCKSECSPWQQTSLTISIPKCDSTFQHKKALREGIQGKNNLSFRCIQADEVNMLKFSLFCNSDCLLGMAKTIKLLLVLPPKTRKALRKVLHHPPLLIPTSLENGRVPASAFVQSANKK